MLNVIVPIVVHGGGNISEKHGIAIYIVFNFLLVAMLAVYVIRFYSHHKDDSEGLWRYLKESLFGMAPIIGLAILNGLTLVVLMIDLVASYL